VILCSGTLGSIPFRAKAEAAAAAGFTGVSIYSREYEPGVRSMLDDLGLSVAEVDGPMAWMPGQPGSEPERVLQIAAELGARSCTVLELTLQPPQPDAAIDAFGSLCDRAATLGIAMHIEPFAWSGVATLRAAADIVAGADRPNGGIILDTWHHVRGPDRGVLDPDAAELVVAVQISDPADVPMPSIRDDCMHNRRWPGAVARRVVDELRALGNDAPLEVETFTDGSDAHAQAHAAAAAYRALA
jgi:sugar phosphate isomerase/epimerase